VVSVTDDDLETIDLTGPNRFEKLDALEDPAYRGDSDE
jgi:hypothetical protein